MDLNQIDVSSFTLTTHNLSFNNMFYWIEVFKSIFKKKIRECYATDFIENQLKYIIHDFAKSV